MKKSICFLITAFFLSEGGQAKFQCPKTLNKEQYDHMSGRKFLLINGLYGTVVSQSFEDTFPKDAMALSGGPEESKVMVHGEVAVETFKTYTCTYKSPELHQSGPGTKECTVQFFPEGYPRNADD